MTDSVDSIVFRGITLVAVTPRPTCIGCFFSKDAGCEIPNIFGSYPSASSWYDCTPRNSARQKGAIFMKQEDFLLARLKGEV